MRNTLLTTVAAMMATNAAFAGGLSPTIEDVEVVEDAPASSISPLLILGLLILIGVLVSRNKEEEETTTDTVTNGA